MVINQQFSSHRRKARHIHPILTEELGLLTWPSELPFNSLICSRRDWILFFSSVLCTLRTNEIIQKVNTRRNSLFPDSVDSELVLQLLFFIYFKHLSCDKVSQYESETWTNSHFVKLSLLLQPISRGLYQYRFLLILPIPILLIFLGPKYEYRYCRNRYFLGYR